MIRPYRASDRAATALVRYRAIRDGAAAHYSAAERAAWAPSPDHDPDKPDTLLAQWSYVAEDTTQITGFRAMNPSGYLDKAYVLPEVMVLPEVIGNGTAAALYDTLLARARTAGLTRLTVRATPQSRRFLARRDWQVDQLNALPQMAKATTCSTCP